MQVLRTIKVIIKSKVKGLVFATSDAWLSQHICGHDRITSEVHEFLFIILNSKDSMNSLTNFGRRAARSGLVQEPWICRNCAQTSRNALRRGPQLSQTRNIQSTPKVKQNGHTKGDAAPTMEQIREPFKDKNRNTLYA